MDARFLPYKAPAVDCIGLERGTFYDLKDITKLIEDFYECRNNGPVEYDKVILSTNDERYNDGYR